MIKLFITISSKRHELDTMGDENISLTYSIDDIADLSSKDTSYSKDFQLPATKKNNRIFNHYYDTSRYGTGSDFDAQKSYESELLIDDYVVMKGFLQLISISKKDNEYYYKVVLYDGTANLFETLGDALLSEIDTSDIVHTRSFDDYDVTTQAFNSNACYDNMLNSWTDGIYTDNQDTSGFSSLVTSFPTRNTNVLYPLVSNDQLTLPLGSFFYDLSYPKYLQNYPVSLNLKYVIEKIFKHAGFELDSIFIGTSAFKNIYFDLGAGYEINGFANQFYHNAKNTQAGNLDSSPVSVSTSALSPTIIPLVELQDDTGGLNSTTLTYTVSNFSGVEINLTHIVKNTAAFDITLYLVVTISGHSDSTENGTFVLDSTVCPVSSFKHTRMLSTDYDISGMTAGTTIQAGIYASAAGLQVHETPNQGLLSSRNRLVVYENVNTQVSDIIANNLADVKMADVLRDVFKLFNLVAETTEKKVKIEPYSNFVGTVMLDWTDKVDIDKATIKPLQEIRRVTFKFAEDEDDYYLNKYKIATGKEYGSQQVDINPLSTTDHKIELEVFAPAYVQHNQLTPQLDTLLHIGELDEDTNTVIPFLNKPRLFYKNSTLIDVPQNGGVSAGIVLGNAVQTHEQTSTAHIYSDHIGSTNSNTLILSFGLIDNYNGELPEVLSTKTLYNEYYAEYIRERYDTDDSFLYEVLVDLKASDIYNWSFKNKIKIKDVHYRVNKIIYNSDRSKLSKVELYRI